MLHAARRSTAVLQKREFADALGIDPALLRVLMLDVGTLIARETANYATLVKDFDVKRE